MHRSLVGYSELLLGDYAAAEQELLQVIVECERLGLAAVLPLAQHNLGLALALAGRLDDADRVERCAIAAYERLGDRRMEAASRGYLARVAEARGALAEALRELERAHALASSSPPTQALLNALRSRVLLAQGRPAEALEAARAAIDQLPELGGILEGESEIRLAWAEALAASGDAEGAAAAFADARERLLTRAAKIADPARRARFLQSVPENRRTLEQATAGR